LVKTYYRPSGFEEALKLLADPTDKNSALAGGTTLALNPRGVDGLVDLGALGLTRIMADRGCLRIGATTAIREIQRSEQVRQSAGGIVAEAARNYLTALIRNRATLGGILAAGNFWADLVTVLVALDASVRIRAGLDASGVSREISAPVEEFVQKGPRKSLAGGILCEISIPSCDSPACRCVYNRLAKVETDISILSAAAKVTLAGSGKTIASARIAVGNGSKPVRLKEAEEKIRGKTAAAAADIAASAAARIQADSDLRASAEYRREVAAVLVKRLFQNLS